MRFIYEYRTSDNVLQTGTIDAVTRDEVYAALKERGIRPSRVTEAPGLANKLFGKGKRWIAIAILLLVSLSLFFSLHTTKKEIAESNLFEERAQLYGDPVVIRECEDAGWTNAFDVAFDRYLARYAIPGRKVEPLDVIPPTVEESVRLATIDEKDLTEVAQMKRMVNGMKRELAEYLKAGGSLASYIKRLDIRQQAERGVFESAQRQIQRVKDAAVWKEKNAELRAMGLPMVELPEE